MRIKLKWKAPTGQNKSILQYLLFFSPNDIIRYGLLLYENTSLHEILVKNSSKFAAE